MNPDLLEVQLSIGAAFKAVFAAELPEQISPSAGESVAPASFLLGTDEE